GGGAGRGPAGGEVWQHVGGDGIVDDAADGREARRQRGGTGSEQRVEVDELVPVTGVQRIEQRALGALSAEHGDPHLYTLHSSCTYKNFTRYSLNLSQCVARQHGLNSAVSPPCCRGQLVQRGGLSPAY